MDAATKDNTSSKKKAASSGDNKNEPHTATRSPFLAATEFLEKMASESLQPHVAHILLPQAKKYCLLRSRSFHKLKQVTKFKTDTELIPKSAQLNDFELHASKECQEEPEFTAIKEKVNKATQDYRLTLKSNIIELTQVEEKLLEKEANKLLAQGLKLTSRTLLVSVGEDHSKTDLIAVTILDRHHDKLLKHCTDLNKDAFTLLYKQTNGISTLPNPTSQ